MTCHFVGYKCWNANVGGTTEWWGHSKKGFFFADIFSPVYSPARRIITHSVAAGSCVYEIWSTGKEALNNGAAISHGCIKVQLYTYIHIFLQQYTNIWVHNTSLYCTGNCWWWGRIAGALRRLCNYIRRSKAKHAHCKGAKVQIANKFPPLTCFCIHTDECRFLFVL